MNPEERLIAEAALALEEAYAPYSSYKVGAALLCEDGSVFRGCNVENASYGLSCCAERVALFKAISEGKRRFTAIAVVAEPGKTVPIPCGACRQVLAEFSPELKVIVKGPGEDLLDFTLRELLPFGFPGNRP